MASDDRVTGVTSSFVGIFSLYYSLQYLSLSDATVLQFLAPIFTAIAGAVLLHEPFSWREAAAGGQYHSSSRVLCGALRADSVAFDTSQWPA